ncbi:hypothetical protein J3A83DRAFT_4192329 [Scleroderma citrinum]
MSSLDCMDPSVPLVQLSVLLPLLWILRIPLRVPQVQFGHHAPWVAPYSYSHPGLGPPVDPFAMHADPERIRQTFQKFRILIVGRSNAGKTSILQRVCATTDRPEIYNAQGERIDLNVVEGSIDRGEHNIENELIFRSNPYFIFHDSCGFEAGSRDEFNKMRDFVLDRATTSHLNKRIHAIWYCIAVTDYNRPIVAAEEKFFRECDTKKERLQGQIKNELGQTRFPPTNYVQLANMHEQSADCGPLLKETATALDEEALKLLLVSTQETNLHLCIEWAIKIALWRFVHDQKTPLETLLVVWFPHTKDLVVS